MNGDQRGHEFDTSTGEAAGEPFAFSASTGIAPAFVDSSMTRDFAFEKLSFGQVHLRARALAVGPRPRSESSRSAVGTRLKTTNEPSGE